MEEEIKKLKAEIERLKSLAFEDELTGLINRRALKKHFEPFVQNACHFGNTRKDFSMSSAAMIFIDLDNFKVLNDKYGHEKGDEALKVISSKLKESVRGTDEVARWGGEEFVVLLLGADEEQAYKIAEEMRVLIKEAGKGYGLTASIGVASLSVYDENAFDQLTKYADQAMYKAKNTGKDSVIKYSQLV